MHKGFTLIELVVVTGIIVLLTALILPNYRAGDQQLSLQRATHKLAQDLRRTQEMAMSAQFSVATGGEVPRGGYGIYFQEPAGPKEYLLFGDADNDHQYGSGDYSVENIEIKEGIIISAIETDKGSESNLFIAFTLVDSEVYFSPVEDASWAKIVLANEQNLSETKTVYVNKAGLIAVEPR